MNPSPPRHLYAALAAAEARGVCAAGRRLSVVVEGDTAAVTGAAPRGADLTRQALAHDAVVRGLHDRFSALVPFRLGVRAPPEDELRRLLRDHRDAILRRLRRVRGRVEVALKLRARGVPSASDLDLSAVHALAPDPDDRRERVTPLPDGILLAGVYLVERAALDDVWAALERLRDAAPGRALVGLGPFPPYTFCDLELGLPGASP